MQSMQGSGGQFAFCGCNKFALRISLVQRQLLCQQPSAQQPGLSMLSMTHVGDKSSSKPKHAKQFHLGVLLQAPHPEVNRTKKTRCKTGRSKPKIHPEESLSRCMASDTNIRAVPSAATAFRATCASACAILNCHESYNTPPSDL